MTEKKKVVMKINYAAKGSQTLQDSDDDPQLITEWNIKRITIAAVILFLFIGGGIYLWLNKNESDIDNSLVINASEKRIKKEQASTKTNLADEKVRQNDKLAITVQQQDEISVTKQKPPINGNDNVSNKKDPIGVDVLKSEPPHTEVAMLPDGLKRALISSNIWKKEPVDKLSSPIIVKKNKAISIYYFTELIDMKGKTVYHVWKYKGNTIFKKKINIWGNRWRASTSKLINYTSSGDWSVQLLSTDGQVLNEINFTVVDS